MSEFVTYLHEVFATFGPINSKRMFGGHGIYHQELMIGLVADDTLYLKCDAESRPLFDARGLSAFEYIKKGKAMQMSYLTAPDDIFDDPDDAKLWATRAYQSALRAQAGKKPSQE